MTTDSPAELEQLRGRHIDQAFGATIPAIRVMHVNLAMLYHERLIRSILVPAPLTDH